MPSPVPGNRLAATFSSPTTISRFRTSAVEGARRRASRYTVVFSALLLAGVAFFGALFFPEPFFTVVAILATGILLPFLAARGGASFLAPRIAKRRQDCGVLALLAETVLTALASLAAGGVAFLAGILPLRQGSGERCIPPGPRGNLLVVEDDRRRVANSALKFESDSTRVRRLLFRSELTISLAKEMRILQVLTVKNLGPAKSGLESHPGLNA